MMRKNFLLTLFFFTIPLMIGYVQSPLVVAPATALPSSAGLRLSTTADPATGQCDITAVIENPGRNVSQPDAYL